MALAVGTILSGPAKAENLADALVGAYNTSGLLEQNRALLRAADEDVALAVSTLRPIVDFIVAARRNFSETGRNNTVLSRTDTSGLSATLSLDWTLFDNGQRESSIASAKESVLATRQQLLSIEQSVLIRAVAAYVNVALLSENVALRRNNLRLLGEELRASEDRFDVGEVTRTDVALSQSSVAAARSALASAEGQLANARAEYEAAVGHAPRNLSGQPPLPAVTRSLEAAQAVAVKWHPDLLAAQHQVAAAELAVQRASRALGPTVSAGAQVGLNEAIDSSNFGRDASVSLSMRQRLYQGGGLNAQVRRAMATRDAARGNLLSVQRAVLQDVSDAYTRLQVARSSLTATAERVRASRVAFDGIREEATLGARTTLDVLAAEQELLDSQTEQISARSEESIAAYQLLQVQGLLTAERLNLAVQIYDPTAYYNLAKTAPAATSKQSKQLDRVLKALGKN